MRCQKCGHKIDAHSLYCEYCGMKIAGETGLKKEAVKKNIFGLLSMYTFLLSLVLFTVLPMILKQLRFSISWLSVLSFLGYGLAVVFEIIALVMNKKYPLIDQDAAGLSYGSTAMIFSLFMLVTKFAGIY